MAFISASDAADRRYDVIIVGSGAAGGQSAYTLALAGVKVLMLEAGRQYTPEIETPMWQSANSAPLRGAATPERPLGFYDATVGGGWQVPGEPYVNASQSPEEKFWWWRPRMLGGRTNHWGRVALRNGPYDFRPRSRDGLGSDWPITYEEIAPYYDQVERLIGVYGSNEGLENTPNSSPGVLLPPPKPRVGELLVQHQARQLGIPFIPMHRAVLTAPLDHRRLPALLHPGNPRAQGIVAAHMRGRATCLYATPCGRGCSIRATYQSTTVHLPPALSSGNLDIVCNAMAREIVLDKRGRACGVSFVDKVTQQERTVRGRAVVLAAGACESVRMLLNSRRSDNSGIGNSSGLVGKFIMDTVGSGLLGQIPRLESLPAHNEDGAGGEHLYAPWWSYGRNNVNALGFARGYHIEFTTGRREPDAATTQGFEDLTGGSYGVQFKLDMRRYFGSFVRFAGRGEMIPNAHSYCEIDPKVKDRWGIPVLRFYWRWSDHEIRQTAHMQKTFADIVDALGGRVMGEVESDGRKAIAPGGKVKHEVGGAMMGASPSSSVTNPWGQVWDVPNVIVADGAVFCSNADKNPTLTIMALAWRSAEHLMSLLKRREI